MRPRVVHLVQALSRGGASRAIVSTAIAAGPPGGIISLAPADPLMRATAQAAGLEVLESPTRAELRATIAAADLLVVSFWNTPELYALLRNGLPPVRLALWLMIAGDTAPHIATAELAALADVVAVNAVPSLELPAIAAVPRRLIVAAAEPGKIPERLRPHDGFVVGYVGTLDFAKLHPDFVELCAAPELAEARFLVVGTGSAAATIAAQARARGIAERLTLAGYVEDLAPLLAEMDVYGCPLAPGNYAASELALQGAMAAGIPPVMLPHGAATWLVEHEVSGLIARDEADYPRLLARLARDPGERERLGANARERARSRQPADAAGAWDAVAVELAELPKRARRLPPLPARPFPGAAAFVRSLGDHAGAFAAALAAKDEEQAVAAELEIATAGPALEAPASGGVLHYRRFYPDDGLLRLWSGLVLAASGRDVLAAGEFKRAGELSDSLGRARVQLERSLARLERAAGAARIPAAP